MEEATDGRYGSRERHDGQVYWKGDEEERAGVRTECVFASTLLFFREYEGGWMDGLGLIFRSLPASAYPATPLSVHLASRPIFSDPLETPVDVVG